MCAVVLALVCGACATSTAAHHRGKARTHRRSTGLVRIHTSFEGGPLDPKTHRGALDKKPVGNVRFSVVSSDGRRWHGRTSQAGTRTFTLQPGRYVITTALCGPRRIPIKVLPERLLPLRYACALR